MNGKEYESLQSALNNIPSGVDFNSWQWYNSLPSDDKKKVLLTF